MAENNYYSKEGIQIWRHALRISLKHNKLGSDETLKKF